MCFSDKCLKVTSASAIKKKIQKIYCYDSPDDFHNCEIL